MATYFDPTSSKILQGSANQFRVPLADLAAYLQAFDGALGD